MNHIRTLLLLAALIQPLLAPLFAQTGQGTAYVGLEYQMSYREAWGANRPVILSVYPGSPAEKAGLQAGDILDRVGGRETSTLSEEDFVRLLQGTKHGESVELLVSNFGRHRTPLRLMPVYLPQDALSERDIAKAFAMYSVEDESDILIPYPVSTGTEGSTDLINYATFGFIKPQSRLSDQDMKIEQIIKEALQAKGLAYNSVAPDLLVDAYYSITENPYFDPASAGRMSRQGSLRIDAREHRLVSTPMLPVGTPREAARYNLKFGIIIYNGVNNNKMLWTSEAAEQLASDCGIADYAALTAPLMLMQFPFTRYTDRMVVRFSTHRHLAMGINYRSSDITVVHSVEPGSPAEQAGLKAGDRIIAINGRELGDAGELSKSYINFVKKSMKHRMHEGFFAVKDGPDNCRYWDAEEYPRIAKLLDQKKYLAGFSYLFSFNPWITSSPADEITVDYLRDGILNRTQVRPLLTESCYTTLE